MLMEITVFTDGGSRGNPGASACAAYFPNWKDISSSKFLGEATNNVAEYEGVILALQTAKSVGADIVLLHSDSKLVVMQMSQKWRINHDHLLELWAKAQALAEGFTAVEYRYVPREQNKEADRMVNEELDRHQQ